MFFIVFKTLSIMHYSTEMCIYEKEVVLSGMVCFSALAGKEGTVIAESFSPFTDESGKEQCPAAEAGIHIGDEILEIDGKDASVDAVWSGLRRGESAVATIRREGVIFKVMLMPLYSPEDAYYRIGLVIDDTNVVFYEDYNIIASTISFYDPQTNVYASTGHSIHNNVNSERGYLLGPLCINGVFDNNLLIDEDNQENNKIIGDVLYDGKYGVYGILNDYKSPFVERYKIARPGEVHNGSATMLTTIKGRTPEFIDVTITHIYKDGAFVISIEDESNIGIAYGMSGSVIIQDKKIVGIVAKGDSQVRMLAAHPPEFMLTEFLYIIKEWTKSLS